MTGRLIARGIAAPAATGPASRGTGNRSAPVAATTPLVPHGNGEGSAGAQGDSPATTNSPPATSSPKPLGAFDAPGGGGIATATALLLLAVIAITALSVCGIVLGAGYRGRRS